VRPHGIAQCCPEAAVNPGWLARLLHRAGFGHLRADPMPPLSVEEARARIAASGLFDPAFYVETYGDNVHGDALTHFLSTGLSRGYLPSAGFDPALYRLTVPGCGASNPLLHYLAYRKGRAVKQPGQVFPRLIRKHRKPRLPSGSPTSERIDRYRANVEKARSEAEFFLPAGGERYRVTVPPLEFFTARLERELPFAFARLPHGYWDGRILRRQIAAHPQLAGLPEPEQLALAGRIAGLARPEKASFAEAMFEEVLDTARRCREDPNFFSAVAFKGSLLTAEVFRASMTAAEREVCMEEVRRHFRPEDRLLDALAWKRLADLDRIWPLADACRSRHVILVGPASVRGLDRRWRLQRHTHIGIPPNHGHRQRWSLLAEVRAAVDRACTEPGPLPVVVSMCGGSLAYWLFGRLFPRRREAFYLDLGQALQAWYPELGGRSPWTSVFAATRAPHEGASATPVAKGAAP
jgi:hypothetical protein